MARRRRPPEPDDQGWNHETTTRSARLIRERLRRIKSVPPQMTDEEFRAEMAWFVQFQPRVGSH